jgi:hypothetical protein
VTGTPSSPPASTRYSPRSASRSSAPRCARLVRTRMRSASCVPSAKNALTISSSYHDDISNRCSTSMSVTTTRRDHTVAFSLPSRSCGCRKCHPTFPRGTMHIETCRFPTALRPLLIWYDQECDRASAPLGGPRSSPRSS